MSFSLLLHFLLELSLETNVCSVLKFCPVFWGYVEYKIVFNGVPKLHFRKVITLSRIIVKTSFKEFHDACQTLFVSIFKTNRAKISQRKYC